MSVIVLWPGDVCWGGILFYCPAWGREALVWYDRIEYRAEGTCLRHDLSWRVGPGFSVTTRYTCEALRRIGTGQYLPRPLLGWTAFPDFGRCAPGIGAT